MGLFGRWTGKGRGGEGGNGEAAKPAPGPAGSGAFGDYSGLDLRVERLLSDFEARRFGISPTGTVDYAACREAALTLHSEVTDEESRVALIRFHGALMSTGVEGLRREGRDPAELEALWREDYFSLLAKEAIGAGGEVDEDRVDRINRREREAGRLLEGETFQAQRAPSPPPIRDENGAPTARGVGERSIALWTLVLRSIAPARREVLVNAFAAEGSRDWLTEAELAFLLDDEPDPRDLLTFGWQAERLAVLLWALGMAELPAHDVKCDPIAFAALLPPTSQAEFETFLAGLRLRDPGEIDAVAADIDRSYRAVQAAEADGLEPPPGLDPEILDERMRAAAWLQGQRLADWP
ncbi:MAG TPA: DUF4272 domain-containing protein [Allosphingosinicella sp.]